MVKSPTCVFWSLPIRCSRWGILPPILRLRGHWVSLVAWLSRVSSGGPWLIGRVGWMGPICRDWVPLTLVLTLIPLSRVSGVAWSSGTGVTGARASIGRWLFVIHLQAAAGAYLLGKAEYHVIAK